MTVKLDDQVIEHKIQRMINWLDKDPHSVMQVISFKSIGLESVVPKYWRILYGIPVINWFLDAPGMDQIESQIKVFTKRFKKRNPHYRFDICYSREVLVSNGRMIIASSERYWASARMGYLEIYKDSESIENSTEKIRREQ